jgi:tRNA A-37 threonylcarbamoyl transferase component Bud32
MSFIITNPDYREFLDRQGLNMSDDYLSLQGVVIGGHPDRHVVRVELGARPDATSAFLRREHRVPWKERIANLLGGFGFVSKSVREARMLDSAGRAGVGCSEWIAAGEDDRGRAFLLVRALSGAVDLRAYLDRLSSRPAARRRFFRTLGEALASLHAAGFDHPDLYSKHVLVQPDSETVHFIDWQRSRRLRSLSGRQRCRNLASLHATLADHLATPRDRLACLQSYLQCVQSLATVRSRPLRRRWKTAVQRIVKHANRLTTRRRIRDLRHQPSICVDQQLVWLDGEAMCVTPDYLTMLRGRVPDYLNVSPTLTTVTIEDGSRGLLLRRQSRRPLARFGAWLGRKRLSSPELEAAAVAFRLERFGLSIPRLLAVGQRHSFPWTTDSFLLTELPAKATNLLEWVQASSTRPNSATQREQRWQVLRDAGRVLRKINDAGYEVADWKGALIDMSKISGSALFCIQERAEGSPTVVLGRVQGLRKCGRAGPAQTLIRLVAARTALSHACTTKTDEMRFFLAYLGLNRLAPEAKRIARSLSRPRRSLLRFLSHFRPTRDAGSCKPIAGSRTPLAEWSAA